MADLAPGTDKSGSFPRASFDLLADHRLLEVVLPGQPLDFKGENTASLLHLLMQVGQADLSVGRLYEGHINALYLIHLYANEEQRARWYNDVTHHKNIFGVWNTQAHDGVSMQAGSPGEIILHGSKTFCSGAGSITRPLITADHESGWQMAILPAEKAKDLVPDESFWHPMGMKGSVSHRIDFTGVKITRADLLGNSGDYYRQPFFSGGAIRFAAVQLGGAQAIVNAVVHYLNMLGRTDDAFQRARVAEMTWLVTSGHHWLQESGRKADQWMYNEPDTLKMLAFANMTRTAVEEICTRIMQLAASCVGARGMMAPSPIERILRDLTFYLRQPAPDASRTAIGEFVLNQKINVDELWR